MAIITLSSARRRKRKGINREMDIQCHTNLSLFHTHPHTMRSAGGLRVLLLTGRHHYESRLFLICHLRGGGRPTEARRERAGRQLQKTNLCSIALFLLQMCGDEE